MLKRNAFAIFSFIHVKIEIENYKLIYAPQFEDSSELGKICVEFAKPFNQLCALTPRDYL